MQLITTNNAVEEENLLAILPEGLDTKQTFFELDRLYHLEEDEDMHQLILQCRHKIEGVQDLALDEYPIYVAEEIRRVV